MAYNKQLASRNDPRVPSVTLDGYRYRPRGPFRPQDRLNLNHTIKFVMGYKDVKSSQRVASRREDIYKLHELSQAIRVVIGLKEKLREVEACPRAEMARQKVQELTQRRDAMARQSASAPHPRAVLL